MTLPSLFIASSKASLKVARALQAELSDDFECTVWDQDHFRMGESTMAGLCRAGGGFDFAAVVVTPDDQLSNGQFTPRDNIVFEAGLFVGALGPERVALVVRSDVPVKAPTDWNGITYAPYKASRADENLRAAIGPAATRVRDMGALGRRPGSPSIEINNEEGDGLDRDTSRVLQQLSPVDESTELLVPAEEPPGLTPVVAEDQLPDSEALTVWRAKQAADSLSWFEHPQLKETLALPELIEQSVEGAFSRADTPDLVDTVNQRLQISELLKRRKEDRRPAWQHFEFARGIAMDRPREFSAVAASVAKQRRPRRFGEVTQPIAPAELLEMVYAVLSAR